ncbi:MAG: hypothetical protein ACKOX4_06125, partial [Bacteroidota bacterium]
MQLFSRRSFTPMVMGIALAIIGLGFHCKETRAQSPEAKPFSLSAAIQYGIDHHTASLNASEDILSSKARIREITSIGLPQVRGSYGVTDNFIIQKVIIPDGRLFNPNAPPGPLALEFQPQYGGNAN